MFTGPVGPVEVFFYWPLAILGIYWLAWGHRTTVSVEPWHVIDKWVQLIVELYLGLNIYMANNDNQKKKKK